MISERVTRTTAIARQTMDIEERGVRLRLSVVDTPGFGDALDCEDSWRAVCSYVDQQFSQFFQVKIKYQYLSRTISDTT